MSKTISGRSRETHCDLYHDWHQFVAMFCRMAGMCPYERVTRIEYRYID
jgi:hypothetical protein